MAMLIRDNQSMSTPIGIRELREDMRTIVGRVIAGDTFTLTDYGHPVARIVPVAHNERYTVDDFGGTVGPYCIPCGMVIATHSNGMPDLLAAIGTHDAEHHSEVIQP